MSNLVIQEGDSMGVVAEPPEAGAPEQVASNSSIAFEHGGEPPITSSMGSQPLPVWTQPLGGWMVMADLVGDEAPQLSDLMRSCGYLARAAIEEQTPKLLASTLNHESFTEVPEVVRIQVQSELLDGLLPVTARMVADEALACREDLDNHSQELLRGNDPLVAAAVEVVSGSSALATELPLPRPYRIEDGPRWWATASLDLPAVLGTNGSIYCELPVHRGGDHTVATEVTYVDRDFEALQNDNVQVGLVPETYRDDIDLDRVAGYFDTIDPSLHHFFFVLRLHEQHKSRLARRLGKLVADSRPRVRDLVKDALAQAQLTATSLMEPHAALVSPVLKLFENLPSILLDRLLSVLERSLADVNMPSWTISHTVACVSEFAPVSVFLLSSFAAPDRRLHWAEWEEAPSYYGRWTGFGEPSTEQQEIKVRDDYDHHPKFHYSGRVMLGESRPVGRHCPIDLWRIVADLGHPVTWSGSRTGLHVLIPHEEPNGDGCYVSAVRADVRYLEDLPARDPWV
jgi:hypothetical protein